MCDVHNLAFVAVQNASTEPRWSFSKVDGTKMSLLSMLSILLLLTYEDAIGAAE